MTQQQLAEQIAAHDWALTPLGPREAWPHSLNTAVDIILDFAHPAFLAWSSDLIFIYNDAYISVLTARHPWALGQPMSTVWADIWDVTKPLVTAVVQTGRAIWRDHMCFMMVRGGRIEETYFSFSYSPLRDDHGHVQGILCSASNDTTERYIDARRFQTLSDLAAKAFVERSTSAACKTAGLTLGRNPADVPFALIYLSDHLGHLHLSEAVGVPTAGFNVWLEPFDVPALLSGASLVGEAHVPSAAPLVCGLADQPVREMLALPITVSGLEAPLGLLVVGVNPCRPLDDDYHNFLRVVAGQLATAVQNAKAYEEERRRAEALAELDRAKTTFFSNVSHELRTPLTLMRGPLEDFLGGRKGPLSEEQRRDMALVNRSTHRLVKLVNNLLDFSRLEAKRMEVALEPTELGQVTRELASMFASAVISAELRLELDCESLSSAVLIDRDMWEKIVLNLLANALKFTHQGAITVRLAESPSVVTLTVADTGIGIPASELPKLFERFHRVQGAQGRTHEGTGIGLALVQELVKLHGGSVEVSSTLGAGSCFTVRVPRRSAAGSVMEPARPASAERAALFVEDASHWLDEETQTASDRGAGSTRILIADDNPDMRRYLHSLIEPFGSVDTVSDGQAALAKLQQQAYDLLLTDVMMPRLDGFELIKALRSSAGNRELPVILLSARAGEEAKVEGLSAGADDYLVKPFSGRELIARVQAILSAQALRRERERQNSEQRMRLYSLLMQAPTPIAVLRGRDLAFELANDHYSELVGTKRPLIGVPLATAFPDLPQDFIGFIERVLATGERFVASDYAVTLHWSNSQEPFTKYLNFVYERVRASEDADYDIMVLAIDVTAQVEARREMAALLEAADAANKTKTRFLANMSHEIRTPLGVILGFTDLLKDEQASAEERASYADAITRSGQVLGQLIDDILDLSKIEMGKLDVERVPTPLAELTADVRTLLGMKAAEKRLNFSVRSHGELPEVITTDPTRLRQILFNIVGNAIKFTERGEVVLTQQMVVDNGRPLLAFDVADSGIGLDAEQQQRLFKAFSQADSSMTRRFGGTGLGLELARRLSRALGGDTVLLRSEPGRGSTFRITIDPAADRSKDHALEPVVEQAKGFAKDHGVDKQPSTKSYELFLSNRRILVVEDSPDNQFLVGRILKRRGAAVAYAANGREGVDLAIAEPFDLVLMDVQMPVLDGYQATAELRQRGFTAPIIALTAHAMKEDREACLLAGYTDYFTKPIHAARLLETIRRHLDAGLAG